MTLSTLTAISPLDGRYHNKINDLRPIFSEFALIHHRIMIEIAWLKQLTNTPDIFEAPILDITALTFLDGIVTDFNTTEATAIKKIEQKIQHDVKAVEYYLKEKMASHSTLRSISEFIHFACTSEDINNLAYACMLEKARTQSVLPLMQNIINAFVQIAHDHAAQPMLARTHGQPATPTTLGKEMANIVARLTRQRDQIVRIKMTGKLNGAVGNFNAHVLAYPNVNWLEISKTFVEQLGLQWNCYTTQIEPHDTIAELCHAIERFNTILIDACRDLWSYISLGYLKQKMNNDEIGSSTMPHKINPIDFENAEGNASLANALLQFFAQRLPISRWQRDLVDSTLLRNLGVAIGHSLVAYQALLQGLHKLDVNKQRLEEDLTANPEVLAEAIQTVMRRYGLQEPYEQLKQLTRGKILTIEIFQQFIDSLALPTEIKQQLSQLAPRDYIGLAKTLALDIRG